MKRFRAVVVLVVVSMLALATVASAADSKKKNAGKKAAKVTETAQAVTDLATAGKLAEYARKTKSASAMLVAAQIVKNTPVSDKPGPKKKGAKASDAAAKPVLTAEGLLAEAKTLAAGNADMIAMIDKEASLAATRGALRGATRTIENVKAGTSDTYTVAFRGGECARVTVIGDGAADTDLYIYDENGNLVTYDADSTATSVVEWYPATSGYYTLKVKNVGNVSSDYTLITN